MPPLFEDEQVVQNASPETTSVMHAFAVCEEQSRDDDGNVDADLFAPCFIEQKHSIEATHPHAFDFLDDGWTFLITMLGLFLLYYYVLSPRIDKLIPAGKVHLPMIGEDTSAGSGDEFDIGKWTYDLGQKAWQAPKKLFDGTIKTLKDNGFIK